MKYIVLLMLLISTTAAAVAAELYYLDRVEISFSEENRFYSKNCSNVAEVEGKLTNPLRYKVSLDCKTSKNRPIGLSLILSPKEIVRVLEREETIKLRNKSFYCI